MSRQDGPPDVVEQMGLALRAHRRALGVSQRAYALTRGLSKSLMGRVERDAGRVSLRTAAELLAGTGFVLAVVREDEAPDTRWDETDLLARTRAGARFPAHREVRSSRYGPRWWTYHEEFGYRADGPRPVWTAEGFTPPPGTRYGKRPRPRQEGEGPRWPW